MVKVFFEFLVIVLLMITILSSIGAFFLFYKDWKKKLEEKDK